VSNVINRNLIRRKLTAYEVNTILDFLTYHFSYDGLQGYRPEIVYAKTAKEFATYYQQYKTMTPEIIHDVNKSTTAFFDHTADPMRIVFAAFSYIKDKRIEVPQFVIPMATVIHEFIHFIQYYSGGWGSWKLFYEGVPEVLSMFFTNDYENNDYKNETVLLFNLLMAASDDDVMQVINWMRRYITHSNKNIFVYNVLQYSNAFYRRDAYRLLNTVNSFVQKPGKFDKIKNKKLKELLTQYKHADMKLHLTRAYKTIFLR